VGATDSSDNVEVRVVVALTVLCLGVAACTSSSKRVACPPMPSTNVPPSLAGLTYEVLPPLHDGTRVVLGRRPIRAAMRVHSTEDVRVHALSINIDAPHAVTPIYQQAHHVETRTFHDLPVGTTIVGLTFDGTDQAGQRVSPADYSVQFTIRAQPKCAPLTDTGADGGWIVVR